MIGLEVTYEFATGTPIERLPASWRSPVQEKTRRDLTRFDRSWRVVIGRAFGLGLGGEFVETPSQVGVDVSDGGRDALGVDLRPKIFSPMPSHTRTTQGLLK